MKKIIWMIGLDTIYFLGPKGSLLQSAINEGLMNGATNEGLLSNKSYTRN